MASLSSGVLLKLLGEMGVDGKVSEDRKPVLLQVRSIIPVLAEDDLWPNQGFYLKVSDSSHAMYVSLPQEQDDMVLRNKLRLGQLIYVEKLEIAYPVPMLKGVKPVRGRYACVGNPKDLMPIDNLVNARRMGEKDHDLERMIRGKIRSLSASKVGPDEEKHRRGSSRSRSERRISDGKKVSKKTSTDKDSDCESSISSSSSAAAVKRRSWSEREISDFRIIKEGIKPIGRTQSAQVSMDGERLAKKFCPASAGNDSSDDNSSSKAERKDIGIDMKSVESSHSCRIPRSEKWDKESLDPAVVFSLVNDEKLTETTTLSDSLPSTLMNLAKEMSRHRDMALHAAVEALQEAAAAERLLKCTSTYSELQAAKGNDQQPSVENFFSLQDDLAHTQFLIQSLIDVSSPGPGDPNGPDSIRDSLKLALDRKKNATTWIKAALASDLTLFSAPKLPAGTTSITRKSSRIHSSKPKSASLYRKTRNNGEIHGGLAAEKDSPPQWVQGHALHAAACLTNSLGDECRRWFFGFVESYLDEVKSKTLSMESYSEQAEMMCQIKKVSDLLDLMVNRNTKSLKIGSEESSLPEDSELEVYGRVRNKIYAVLLKHVERTAVAFENMNAKAEG